MEAQEIATVEINHPTWNELWGKKPEAEIEVSLKSREWSTRELGTFVACAWAIGLLIGVFSAKVSLIVYGCALVAGVIIGILSNHVADCINGDA